jgi:hypothetical protein
MYSFTYHGKKRYAMEIGPTQGGLLCKQFLPERGLRTFKPGKRMDLQKVSFLTACAVKLRSLF